MHRNGMSSFVVLCGLSFFVAGCATSPIPLAENFELTTQQKVRSAGHWELLSRDVVAQTSTFMQHSGIASGVAYYVEDPVNASAFDKAFRQFLITDMVQNGQPVSMNPGAPVNVTYEVQVVRHNSSRPRFIPGQYTVLATGLLAAYGVSTMHVDAQRLALVGAAAGADYLASINSGGPTNTELILTTTLSSGSMYLARTTDVYYLENVDAGLFSKTAPARTFEVAAE